MSVRHLSGLPVLKMLAQSDVYYQSYCPKPLQNWAQLGHEAKKNKKKQGYPRGKVPNNKQLKVKLMDTETMDRQSYHSLCKNLC